MNKFYFQIIDTLPQVLRRFILYFFQVFMPLSLLIEDVIFHCTSENNEISSMEYYANGMSDWE